MSSSKGPSAGSKGRNRKKGEVPPPTPPAEKEMSVTYTESEPESDSAHGDSSPSLVLLSESWRPEYRNKAVPLPAGIRNFRQWGKTVCTMPKYRRSRLCFDELLELGRGKRRMPEVSEVDPRVIRDGIHAGLRGEEWGPGSGFSAEKPGH